MFAGIGSCAKHLPKREEKNIMRRPRPPSVANYDYEYNIVIPLELRLQCDTHIILLLSSLSLCARVLVLPMKFTHFVFSSVRDGTILLY